MEKYDKVGKFEIESGEVLVTDPCYSVGTWCQGHLKNVKKGKWEAEVARAECFGLRIAELICRHEDARIGDWEVQSFEVGVDSGQAGIFDLKYYKDDASVNGMPPAEYINGDKWYSVCCAATNSEDKRAGVLPYGAVSSSGLGDGGYECFVTKDDEGVVDGIRIVFLTDEEL